MAIVKAPPNPLAFCEVEVIGHSYRGKNNTALALVSSFVQVFISSLCNNNINDDDDDDDDDEILGFSYTRQNNTALALVSSFI